MTGGNCGTEMAGDGGELTSSVERYEGGLSASSELDSKEAGLLSTDMDDTRKRGRKFSALRVVAAMNFDLRVSVTNEA
jgi:hypothetical protein